MKRMSSAPPEELGKAAKRISYLVTVKNPLFKVHMFAPQASIKKNVTTMVETVAFQLLMTNFVHLNQVMLVIAMRITQGTFHLQKVCT